MQSLKKDLMHGWTSSFYCDWTLLLQLKTNLGYQFMHTPFKIEGVTIQIEFQFVPIITHNALDKSISCSNPLHFARGQSP